MIQQTIMKEDMTIRQLNKNEIISIYTTHSIRHFPKNELKPVSSIERMISQDIYTGYGLYNRTGSETLLCYAFFTVLPDKRNILLDYFAVMEDYRGHGIGSLFLSHMKSSVNKYDGFLIESEDPDHASDETELHIRNKRLDFYFKNGAFFTGILAEVFDVHYKLLFLPIRSAPSTETLYSDFDSIYRNMVSHENYKNKIHIFLP